MERYYSLNEYYKKKFGKKVYKLSISGGMTCPNRDGTLDTRGCIFCSAGGSGEFSQPACLSVSEQLERAKQRVQSKTRENAYIAYFQPFTNTYAPVSKLRELFYEAIRGEEIVGLSVATRPDCLPEEVIALLSELNRIKPVSVELGLQTIHESTAVYIRRGYPLSVYDKAVADLRAAGIEIVTHVILGLPGESSEMMADTVRYVGRVTDGIKLQLLHVLSDTDLASECLSGRFVPMSFEEYAAVLCRCIEILPRNVVVHRITGDGDKRKLIAPLWSADKKRVLNDLRRIFDEKDIRQGRSCGGTD